MNCISVALERQPQGCTAKATRATRILRCSLALVCSTGLGSDEEGCYLLDADGVRLREAGGRYIMVINRQQR